MILEAATFRLQEGTEGTPYNDVGRRQSKTAGTKATPLYELAGFM
jgi:hypothetical protein